MASKIPFDFIEDAQFYKNGRIEPKYERKLQARFAVSGGRQFFYKSRHTDESRPVPLPALEEGVSPLEDFAKRYEALRRMLVKMMTPRLKEYFRQNCYKLIRKGGLKRYENCRSMDDFLRAFKHGEYGKEARAMYFVVCFEIWMKTGLGKIEEKVMEILGLVYKKSLCDGSKLLTNRGSGSVKNLGSRIKKTICNDNMR